MQRRGPGDLGTGAGHAFRSQPPTQGRLRVIAITDAGYLALIREVASMAKSGAPADSVVDRVKDQLIEVLELEDCRFEYGSLLGHPPRLEPDGTVVTRNGRWPVDQSELPMEEIELRTLLQARLVAVTLADQVGRAFGAASTQVADA
jgi:hypothetical protein